MEKKHRFSLTHFRSDDEDEDDEDGDGCVVLQQLAR